MHVRAHSPCDQPRFVITASQSKPLTPLCPSSAHYPAVHTSWPKAVAKRIHTLSGGDMNSHIVLCNRYRSVCTHSYTQNTLDGWNPHACSKDSESKRWDSSAPFVPFVFQYHPCTSYSLYRALKLVPPPREVLFNPRVCWRNRLPALRALVQKANKKSLSRDLRLTSREGRCFLYPKRNLLSSELTDFRLERLREYFVS